MWWLELRILNYVLMLWREEEGWREGEGGKGKEGRTEGTMGGKKMRWELAPFSPHAYTEASLCAKYGAFLSDKAIFIMGKADTWEELLESTECFQSTQLGRRERLSPELGVSWSLRTTALWWRFWGRSRVQFAKCSASMRSWRELTKPTLRSQTLMCPVSQHCEETGRDPWSSLAREHVHY